MLLCTIALAISFPVAYVSAQRDECAPSFLYYRYHSGYNQVNKVDLKLNNTRHLVQSVPLYTGIADDATPTVGSIRWTMDEDDTNEPKLQFSTIDVVSSEGNFHAISEEHNGRVQPNDVATVQKKTYKIVSGNGRYRHAKQYTVQFFDSALKPRRIDITC